MKEFRHKCELRLLVCEPNPLRPDRVTIGFILRDTNGDEPRVEVRFASNLRAIQCIYPEADLEAIEGTLREMEPVLKNVTDFEHYLSNMPADLPVDLNFLPGTALLTDSIEDEVALLTKQYLARPAKLPRADSEVETDRTSENETGRPYIRRKMQEAFRHFGVLEFMSPDMPVEKYTFKGGLPKLDFAYRNPRTDTLRIFHAVSAVTNIDQATILSLSWPSIREGMRESGQASELFGVVEDPKFHKSELSIATLEFMRRQGLVVRPVSDMMTIAAEVRTSLRL